MVLGPSADNEKFVILSCSFGFWGQANGVGRFITHLGDAGYLKERELSFPHK